eukprot:328603-Ditylum_brightwellii.AAC.1
MQKWQHDGAALEEQVEVGCNDNNDGNDGQGNVDDAAVSEIQTMNNKMMSTAGSEDKDLAVDTTQD